MRSGKLNGDATKPSPLSVSIVIATVNRAASLDRTLYSLRQLRYPLFEAIVVNGPSNDHSAEIAAKHADFIRYYQCTKMNLSASRNIGIAVARGDIVAFIDDDAIPEPDWLNKLLPAYDDPTVAQVGGFVLDNRGIDYQCKYILVDRLGQGVAFNEKPHQITRNNFLGLTGTNFTVRRSLLLDMRGFDEEFIYFLDETDVTIRLVDQGWSSVIVPDAEIHHKFEPSHMRTVARVPRTMYPQLRSKAYFCCVHGMKVFSLTEIFDHLVDHIRKEREWKTDLYRYGHTDMIVVNRLIDEVERGTSDGVHDAFAHTTLQGIDEELLLSAKDSTFKPFPLPLLWQERLQICFLSQDYPPIAHGGIGQWTREMAIGLAGRGHEVTVICRSDTEYSYIDFVDGVWVHRIIAQPHPLASSPKYAPAPHSLLHYSGCVFDEIMRIQQHRQFQLVCGPIFDLEPLITAGESNIPTVFSLHTTYQLSLPHKPDWLHNQAYRLSHVETAIAKEREVLETTPYMESNTTALLDDLDSAYDIQIDRKRAVVIHRGLNDLSVDVEPFPVRQGITRVLFVGRLELRKGADLFLQALPGLLRRYPNVEVDIVGDDKVQIEGTTLRRNFELTVDQTGTDMSRVTFHGTVSREELLKYYATCDIFVAPSRYESFGLIFVEAMIFGKPSVGIAVGGAVEVVTDGIDGLLIERPDANLLENRIAMLIDNPQMRKELGAAARHTFESRFSLRRMLDESEIYYRKVVAAHPTTNVEKQKEAHL